jgi:DNA-binding PadR family transcriptional regulator
MDSMVRSFFLGFIKIHILHHATKEPVYGLWFIEELKRHGYEVSPGTMYPIFHSLRKEGLLRSYERLSDGKIRKYYRTTPKGKKTLQQTNEKVRELFNEIFED